MEPEERKTRKRKRWLIGVGIGLVLAFGLIGIRFNLFASKGDDMLHVIEFSEDGGGGEEAFLNVTLTLSNPTHAPLLTARQSINISFFDFLGNRVMDSRERIDLKGLEPSDVFVLAPGEKRRMLIASYGIKRSWIGMGFCQISWHSLDFPDHTKKEFEELRIEKKGTYNVGSHETGKLFYQLD